MQPRSPKSIVALLALLTLTALATRAWQLDAGLPHRSEPDAVMVWQAGGMQLVAEGKPERHLSYLADFYPYLLAWTLLALPGNSAAKAAPAEASLEEHLSAAAEPYVRGRWLILILSLLGIPLCYSVSRRFMEPPWALLAAALVATSLLHTSMSQMARPHGAVATFFLLSNLASLRLLERPTAARTLVAGLAAALAVATLHSGAFVLPTAVLAAGLAPARSRWVRAARIGVILAVTAAAVVVFYPFLFDDIGLGAKPGAEGDVLNLGGQSLPLSQYGLAGYRLIVPNLLAVDPMLVLLGGLGVVALIPLLRGRRELLRPFLIAGATPLVTFLSFGLHPSVHVRFLLPLIPWLALLGALPIRALLRGRVRPAAAAAISCLVLVLPTAAVTYTLVHRAAEDSHTRLARWLAAEKSDGPFPIIVPFGTSLPAWIEPARWGKETQFVWTPWISYLVHVLEEVPADQVLDIQPWVPNPEVPDSEALLEELERLRAGVLVVRRPLSDQGTEFLKQVFPREGLVETLGEPVLELVPQRRIESPLARRLVSWVPVDLRRIVVTRYPGWGYEVYALPRAD